MREIKFRAWDVDEKAMVQLGNMTDLLIEMPSRRQLEAWNYMQYTGLKDKNGVEIYHKDLVSNGTNVFEVVWAKRFGGWAIVDRKTVKQQHHLLVNSLKYQEVIGNIYENHELLEANQ